LWDGLGFWCAVEVRLIMSSHSWRETLVYWVFRVGLMVGVTLLGLCAIAVLVSCEVLTGASGALVESVGGPVPTEEMLQAAREYDRLLWAWLVGNATGAGGLRAFGAIRKRLVNGVSNSERSVNNGNS
jgi:hypothetical protein